ncbi:cartilage-associated protein-like [Condylostylus longicornis]|uniref:cartilage-associated protein-like n=1 Tax=Condylostylus longicornis TaxID=2530218 RepID=UPI00244E0144|nr:cartilage-associated protein-like [Condylostylus longicornis]
MNLHMNAFFSNLLLLAVVIVTISALNEIKNENKLITTKNEYIINHIFLVFSNPKIDNYNQETEVKSNNNKTLINNQWNNDSFILEEKERQSVDKQIEKNETIILEYKIIEDHDEDQDDIKTFVDYYHDGVTSYLGNDWVGCISSLERAVVLYNDYYNTLTYCRVSCDMERSILKPTFEENYGDYHFYEGILHKTLCLEKCRNEQLKNIPKFFTVEYKDKIIFKQRKPYNYLQICYFKDKEVSKAIDAAFTALLGDPNDIMLKKNIEFYASTKDFNYENMKDLEDKEFTKFYLQGMDDYNIKNWTATINNFEKFIEVWIQEYDKCRAFCEDDYQQGWLPDYDMALANQYVYVLRCKQNCTFDLNLIGGRTYGDSFASAYDYLQFSYFQIGEIEKAVKCVSSYLLLHPESVDMLETLRYYKTIPNITEKYFQPREEIKKMVAMRKYEIYLLEFVDNEFTKISHENIGKKSKLDDTQDQESGPGDANTKTTDSQFFNIINNFIEKWKNSTKIF